MTTLRTVRTLGTAALALPTLLSVLGGCSASVDHAGSFTFASSEYPAAFDATHRVLREFSFDLERIDEDAGVISTAPTFSPGLLEPWSPLQSGLGDEWEDTINHQGREVRVTFAPEGQTGETMRGSVWVTVIRQHRSGKRLDSEWVGGSSYSIDPQQVARYTSTYTVPIRRDESLEARLAGRIEDDLHARREHTDADTTDADATDADAEAAEASDAEGA